MQPVKKWSQELEGLRGLASLWVVLGHICILTNFWFPILADPAMGVDLFILLSGYLMAKNYVERKDKEPWNDLDTIKKFWMRRFFRIAPLYYVLLILAITMGSYYGEARDVIGDFYSATQTNSSRYSDNSFANIISHVTFLFGIIPSYSFNTVLPDWSIGLEMQFYFLFPFIMLVVTKLGFARACFLAIVVCATCKFIAHSYFNAFPMPSLILMKLNVFISGMLIAEAVRRKSLKYTIFSLLAISASVYLPNQIKVLHIAAQVSMVVMMLIILWQREEDSKWARKLHYPKLILTNRFSVFLGDVSYSVYLLHLLIVLPVVSYLLSSTSFSEFPGITRFALSCIIIIPITYGSAVMLYKFIEKPGIKLGRYLITKKE
ncbi:acyltransferase [Erwinia sp. S38]|uniref:acyltransferase family protein n=1 Tax=Erwinia sp. S38 TaxID=2769338 RepID=UPI00190CFD5E|nr:acyltransferase [Erwinia sp. S38]MBK0003183.1 acyltransferase [Erwinia sp. S38]